MVSRSKLLSNRSPGGKMQSSYKPIALGFFDNSTTTSVKDRKNSYSSCLTAWPVNDPPAPKVKVVPATDKGETTDRPGLTVAVSSTVRDMCTFAAHCVKKLKRLSFLT